ncbi:DUF983 domain-containing protein [Paraflavisolibacter sp. H34]|uniref:DUF983 domain-containing protein n=1 Tax=Huijunlia imazamoxiresistens TaxID=3127457 RepID=UPI003018CDA0
MMNANPPHRSYPASVLQCRCPRCREGKLFKNPVSIGLKRNMEMNPHCPVCGQPTDIEVGFYYGTGYVSYVLALLISGISFVAWWLAIGFSFQDNRFLYWVIANAVLLIVLQPWLMRLSRSLWISWFVRYDPNWKNHKPDDTERVVEGQMGNW